MVAVTEQEQPQNYFADIEQAAFSPSTMVPGFAASADPGKSRQFLNFPPRISPKLTCDSVLQARLFAYPDAARYRLGVNYQQLPTNAAKVQVYCPFQRDGKMRFDHNYGGDPSYVGSTIKPTNFYQDVKGSNPEALFLHTEHEKWAGEVSAYSSEITDADFVQPAALWKLIGREPGHQDRLIDNLVLSIKDVKYPDLRKAVYGTCALPVFSKRSVCCSTSLTLNIGLFSRVDKVLGSKLQERTEAAIKAA